MASSDEDGEIMPDRVTNYHFVNNKEEPVSFTILPVQWSEGGVPDGLKEKIFLRGTVDNGLQKIYKQVIAWKFDLSYVLPEILVLSKNKNWLKLQKPWKTFENQIRTILITVYFLHFVKKNPEASEDVLWNLMVKSFSSYEVKPSKNDLLDHMPFIAEVAKLDKDLTKSEYLRKILLEKHWVNKTSHEDVQTTKKLKFIVDENEDDEDGDCDEEEDEDELFDHVCAICDNGGELLCCEGRCMRSFHATLEAGAESGCKSLGLSNAEVEAIQSFLCKNCKYQRHQCYICGTMGSSSKSCNAEVFPCVSAMCGHFYHPECISKVFCPGDEAEAKLLESKIASGESFICPAHKCCVCKQGEDKMIHDLQFAICRRCPKAYHRKCLPKTISFDATNGFQRAWEGLLPNRILIYCMEHKIIEGLWTPERNHVIFPATVIKLKKQSSELLSSRMEVGKKRFVASKSFPAEKTAAVKSKEVKNFYSSVKGGDSTKKVEKTICGQSFAIQKKPNVTELKSYKEGKSALVKQLSTDDARMLANKAVQSTARQQLVSTTIIKIAKPVKRAVTPLLADREMENRLLAMIDNCDRSFNKEKFMSKFERPSTHAGNPKNVMDKITLGKVEASVKAVRTALKKLEDGGSIEDAKAVCDPQILTQLIKWKGKLEVYLAPFLHGKRYTSYGRHFTTVEKLKEIVDLLYLYVQDGDVIVDFCCGSNDFSCLMKEKLEKVGKTCSFKNYDLHQPKKDFCFEKKNWMKVHPKELPEGSKLIMGLNPPFGKEASLANKFIDKALQFKPKLLILIVPEVTKRLDEKDSAYELIWEDNRMLSGKSFYLPGSLDVNNKQLKQWNVNPPLLCLWSRPDWAAHHRQIAKDESHFFKEQQGKHVDENDIDTFMTNYLMEEKHDCYGDFSNIIHGVGDISGILDDVPEDDKEVEPVGKSPFSENGTNEDENMIEMQSDEKQQTSQSETLLLGEFGVDEFLEPHEMCLDMELSSPTSSHVHYKNLESLGSDSVDRETEKGDFSNLQSSLYGSKSRPEYEGSTSNPIHVGNRHDLVNVEAFSTGSYNIYGQQHHGPVAQVGGNLPYHHPAFHPFGPLPSMPYGYPGFPVGNAAMWTPTGNFAASMNYVRPFMDTAPMAPPSVKTDPYGRPFMDTDPVTPPGVEIDPYGRPCMDTEPVAPPGVKIDPYVRPFVHTAPVTAPGIETDPYVRPFMDFAPVTAPGTETDQLNST